MHNDGFVCRLQWEGGPVRLRSGRLNDEKALLGLGPVAGINEPAAFHADVLPAWLSLWPSDSSTGHNYRALEPCTGMHRDLGSAGLNMDP